MRSADSEEPPGAVSKASGAGVIPSGPALRIVILCNTVTRRREEANAGLVRRRPDGRAPATRPAGPTTAPDNRTRRPDPEDV
ncbi:hypothetical protein GCM10010413_38070 [Promicromonospora sukumoe]